MSKPSLHILLVNASSRKDGSVSRMLSDELIAEIRKTNSDATITTRDLADGVPLVDEAWVTANFTPPENRMAEHCATLAYSNSLVDELKDADLIIIGAPIYNFGVPAALKAWIDQITRARLTFKYTENGPVGLLENKKAIIVTASGGTKAGSEIDFASGYLRHILGFIGIHDVAQIAASQLAMDADGALERARAEIPRIAETAAKPLRAAA